MINDSQLKKLKLIILDLDGTLLRNDGTIGPETKKNIQKLKEKGVRFSFASGRLHNALTGYAEELNIKTPLISLDGCMLKNYPDNDVIYESPISKKYVKKAIHLADRLLLNIALCHADSIYYTEENSLVPKVLDKFGADYTECESYEPYLNNTLELAITGDSRKNIRYLENKMTFPSSFGLKTVFYKSHDQGGMYFLEVRKHGSSKATGLKRLCKFLKISISETAVLGDWYNDRDLFETKALKIAMQNAVPEIINLADYVTKKTNDEEGVAEFLEMVLKVK